MWPGNEARTVQALMWPGNEARLSCGLGMRPGP